MAISRGSNSANYFNRAIVFINDPIFYKGPIATSVGTNGGPSSYGTYDQSGNVWEWTGLKEDKSSSSRVIRGGAFDSKNFRDLNKEYGRSTKIASSRQKNIGFRIATDNNILNLPHFTLIGDINNIPDSNGYGSVSKVFFMRIFTVTVCEYVEFLNAVASNSDPNRLYNKEMKTFINITTGTTPKKYHYSINHSFFNRNKPITYVSFFEIIRYCNWLHNGKPSGDQNSTTTEDGAYTIDNTTSNKIPLKNNNAKYYIPDENQWYKAAFYKSGSSNDSYNCFATQYLSLDIPKPINSVNVIGDGPFISLYSCNAPTPTPASTLSTLTPTPTPSAYIVGPTPTSTPIVTSTTPVINSVNYLGFAYWNNLYGNLTTVGTNGISSYYGTYDQSGNVYEWVENKELLGSLYGTYAGGSWLSGISDIKSSGFRKIARLQNKSNDLGFRISSLNNPLNLSNMVLVSDINNLSDNSNNGNFGSVAYNYYIGKYVITNCDYIEFLNSVANNNDPYNLYDLRMTSDKKGGIIQNTISGSFAYSCKPNMCNKPVIYIDWFKAARYCNWLHHSKPVKNQGFGSTEDGAYQLNGALSGSSIQKNNNAKYYIPDINEWYKAAYYVGGSSDAGYWPYATRSDIKPIAIQADNVGNGPLSSTYSCNLIVPTPTATNIIISTATPTNPAGPYPTPTSTNSTLAGTNKANWNLCASWGSLNKARVTTVGSNGGPSAYGAFDMSGNVWEWNDLTDNVDYVRGLRGGAWNSTKSIYLSSYTRSERTLIYSFAGSGFRIASKDNPLIAINVPQLIKVEDIGNKPDTTTYGRVDYSYYIGKYPITNCEYSEFLNSVAKLNDLYLLFNINSNIIRSKTNNNYIYQPATNFNNKPVIYISWLNAARYCNWLHNGKPIDGNSDVTETGAYNLYGNIDNFNIFPKNAHARYYIPTENEWYKAAFYKGGGTNSGYWKYATQSNDEPSCVTANSSGNGPDASNYSHTWNYPRCII